MDLKDIIEKWNTEFDQWDDLNEKEKVEFAYRLGYANGYDEGKRDGEL